MLLASVVWLMNATRSCQVRRRDSVFIGCAKTLSLSKWCALNVNGCHCACIFVPVPLSLAVCVTFFKRIISISTTRLKFATSCVIYQTKLFFSAVVALPCASMRNQKELLDVKKVPEFGFQLNLSQLLKNQTPNKTCLSNRTFAGIYVTAK